jgi:MFS family permease
MRVVGARCPDPPPPPFEKTCSRKVRLMERRALALGLVVLAAAMDLLDGTVVNIVLPVIQRDLHAGDATAAAIASAYNLALGSLLVTGGRLGDLLGHRRVLGIGTAGFTVASILCAAAPSAPWLIAARAIQGTAAAVLVPQTLAIIQRLYPGHGRGRALSVFAAVAGVATVSGPMLGAVITHADPFGLGWRAVFAINVPLGLVILAGLASLPPDERDRDGGGLDLGGAAWLATALALLIAPLLWGAEAGWPWWVPVLLGGAAAALCAFVRHEHRRSVQGRSLLVDPALFGFRSFRGAVTVMALVFGAVYALLFTLVLYLQGDHGWSPMRTAMAILPWTVAIPLASIWASSRLVPHLGRRVPYAGVAMMIAGMALLAWALTATVPTVPSLAPGLLVAGCGMGLVVAPVLSLGLADVPGGLAGAASGVIANVQHIGGSLGVATLGGLYVALPSGPDGTSSLIPVLAGGMALLACALPGVRAFPEGGSGSGPLTLGGSPNQPHGLRRALRKIRACGAVRKG